MTANNNIFISPLADLDFFDVEAVIYEKGKGKFPHKKYLLANFSDFLNQERFADLFLTFDQKGIYVYFDVAASIGKVQEDFRKSDSIEIYIDTRNTKTKGYVTKYCHFFVFYPEKIGNVFGKEITRFRKEEMRNLALPQDLRVDVKVQKEKYSMNIHMPSSCLYGYDYANLELLRFQYRINRPLKPAQNFTIAPDEVAIEKNPCLWALLKLKKI